MILLNQVCCNDAAEIVKCFIRTVILSHVLRSRANKDTMQCSIRQTFSQCQIPLSKHPIRPLDNEYLYEVITIPCGPPVVCLSISKFK